MNKIEEVFHKIKLIITNHKHSFEYIDPSEDLKKRGYTLIRKCECGYGEILHSVFKGVVTTKDNTVLNISIPECWFPLASRPNKIKTIYAIGNQIWKISYK